MAKSCFRCQERNYPYCYSACPDYKERQAAREAEKERKRKEAALDALHAKGVERARKYMHESKER